MKPKYKVGDTVYYRRGTEGFRSAIVQGISTGDGKKNHREPVYTIRLQPSVSATLWESELYLTLPRRPAGLRHTIN